MSKQSEWKKRNRSATAAYRRKWMKDNPKKRREYESRYIAGHRDEVNARRREWKQRTGYERTRNRKIREATLKKYGGKCVCCDEKTFQFLSFDHKNGKGKKHRDRIVASGSKFCLWLFRRKVQKNIQILCHNCNQSLGHYGFCPHRPEITRPFHGRK